jgi:protein SCO1
VKALLSLGAALVIAGLTLACQPQPAMEVFGRAPDFTLVDQAGAPFATQNLAGRVTLLDFVYTHCTDVCPVLSGTFQQAQQRLEEEQLGTKVMLVSLTVDPQHDTPAVLAEYGRRYKADPATWKFLSGDWDQVFDVVTGLKVATRPPRPATDAPVPGGTELLHSSRIVVIDPQQQVRAYLEGRESTGDSLVAAARRLLR